VDVNQRYTQRSNKSHEMRSVSFNTSPITSRNNQLSASQQKDLTISIPSSPPIFRSTVSSNDTWLPFRLPCVKLRIRRPWIVILALFITSMVLTFGRYSSQIRWKPVLEEYSASPATLLKHANLNHLIIVAGHAVYTASSRDFYWDAKTHVSNAHLWALDKFQSQQPDSTIQFLIQSIETGVKLAKEDSFSLLVFSGGKTRLQAGLISEGQSMVQVAEILGWPKSEGISVKDRSITEEYSLDSLDNLLYSLCRFRQMTGRYPKKVSIVSMESKRLRFTLLHARAAKFPVERINFVGIPTPLGPSIPLDVNVIKQLVNKFDLNAKELESLPPHEVQSMLQFAQDEFACKGALKQKKVDRNPFVEVSGYRDAEACPEMTFLLEQCRSESVNHNVPWTTTPE
jgi:hypothetical protein